MNLGTVAYAWAKHARWVEMLAWGYALAWCEAHRRGWTDRATYIFSIPPLGWLRDDEREAHLARARSMGGGS